MLKNEKVKTKMTIMAIAATAMCSTAFAASAAEMWESHVDFTIDSSHFREAPVEWFNTYSPEWKSPDLASRVTYATLEGFPAIRKTDDIANAVSSVKIELIPNSLLIRITATSPNREIVSTVAYNYRECIEKANESKHRARVEIAVARMQDNAHIIQRRIEEIEERIMKIELQTQLSAKKTSRELKEFELKTAARKVSELESALDDAENSLALLKRQLDVENDIYAEALKKLADARAQAESNPAKIHLVNDGKPSRARKMK